MIYLLLNFHLLRTYGSILFHYIWYQQWNSKPAQRWRKKDKQTGEIERINLVDEKSCLENPSEVAPQLYLGNVNHCTDHGLLNKYNISKIVNATRDIPNNFRATKYNIEYCRVKLFDTGNEVMTKNQLHESYEFLTKHIQNHHNILIHCYMGASRSASIVLYYLSRTYKINVHDAMLRLYKLRKIICVNQIFVEAVILTLMNDWNQNRDQVTGNLESDFLLTNTT